MKESWCKAAFKCVKWISTCKIKASTSTAKSTAVTCDSPCASSKWLRKSLQYLLSASKCFYRIRWSFTPQEWDWAALMKSFGSAEASFHSSSYCYLSYTNKNTTEKKITLNPNLNSTGTWKGNVFYQLLGKLGSVKCWIFQDKVNFTAFFKYLTNTKQHCQK